MFTSLLPSSPSDSEDNEDTEECPVKEETGSSNKERSVSKEEQRQKIQERLAELSDERRTLASRNEAKRISAMRKQATYAVRRAFTEEDLEAFEELPKNLLLSRKRTQIVPDEQGDSASKTATEDNSSDHKEKWARLKAYLEPNPQLKGTDPGRHSEPSGLEKTLDKAIEEGDLEKAVKISDQLAGREFAIKIATAFDCLEYLEHQKEEEAKQKKKRPRLTWTFEAKQNWEMKSNM